MFLRFLTQKHMPSKTYISIQEAADLSGKSIQTIRRALKNKKIQHRRRSTPQGFNYVVNKESLEDFYKLNKEMNKRRESGGIKKTNVLEPEYLTKKDLNSVKDDLRELVDEQVKIKQSLVSFMKAFQDRFVSLEHQMKLLEEPKKWYEFWKK